MQDFIDIRKGTNSIYALKKCLRFIKDSILLNGKNLKQEHGFTINFQVRRYD